MTTTLRKYGIGATIDGITLLSAGSTDLRVNPTIAFGDAKISLDGGSFANLTNMPNVAPAGGAQVRLTLTAAEMSCARALVLFVDQTGPKEWQDRAIVIETFGDPSAQHPTMDWTATTLADLYEGFRLLFIIADADRIAASPAATTTSAPLAASAGLAAGELVDSEIIFIGSNDKLTRVITAWAPPVASWDDPLPVAPAPGDFYIVRRGKRKALTPAGNLAAADALLDRASGIEAGWSPRMVARILLAAMAGKSSGHDIFAPKYRDRADTKNRISAVTDAFGNRFSITLDGT